MTSAEKVRAFRERARSAGKCAVCGKAPPATDKTICDECNEAAKVRVADGRAKAKKPKRKKASAKKKSAKAKR